MAQTDKQRRTTTAEDRIALVIDIDEALVHISELTQHPRITDEVKAGRGAARRLWDSLKSERQALQGKKANDGKEHL